MRRVSIALAPLLLIGCRPRSDDAAGTVAAAAAPVAASSTAAQAPAPPAATPAPIASPTAEERPDDGLAALAGSWKVSAVHVDPSDVQALTENDPSDMGAVLDVSTDRLKWRPRDAGEFSDVCDSPKLTLDGQISCRNGQFGPPGAQLLAQGDLLRLNWYDGATLEMRRAK